MNRTVTVGAGVGAGLLLAALLAVTPGPVPQKRVEGTYPIVVYNDGGAYGIRLDASVGGGGQPVEGIGVISVYNDGGSYAVSFDGGTGQPTSAVAPAFIYNDGGTYGVSVSTTAALTLFVDPTGTDTGACLASGTSACATLPGALNKVPKVLRHKVTINVAAGNYGGAIISGFTQDQTVNGTTGGLYILGTLANSTVATGSATGTATSATAGSGVTFGTLTNTGASWTTNDLVGSWLVITGGTASGQYAVISSNTATTITIVGPWSVTPNATSTYAIQQPASIITTGTAPVPRGNQTTSGTTVGLGFVGNSVRDLGGIFIQNMGISATTFAAYVYGGSAPLLNTVKYTRTGSGGPFVHSGIGTLYLDQCYSQLGVQTAGSQAGAHITNDVAGLTEGQRLGLSRTLVVNGQYAMFAASTTGLITQSEFRQIDRGVEFLNSTGTVANTRIGCAGGSGQWGVAVGARHDGATSAAGVGLTNVNFENCSYAIEQGGGNSYLLGLTGLTGRAAVNLRGGGKVTINGATATGLRGSDGGLHDWQIDAYGGVDPLLGAWTEFIGVGDGGAVGSCIGTLAGASSICTQP